MQKFLTRRSQKKINKIYFAWEFHRSNLLKKKKPLVIEFGAGKDLRQNVFLSNICSSQTLVDINKMLDMKLFNKHAKDLSLLDAGVNFHKCANLEDLTKFYGIKYIAPVFLENCKFSINQFDFCLSTDTLEHIPKKQIYSILKTVKKIVKNNGFLSFVIDYSDHYSHTDNSINSLHFLKFSEQEWKKYNHKSHYQNRLRHTDYRKIFKDLNFKVVKEDFEIYKHDIKEINKNFDIDDQLTFALYGTFLLKNLK